jgi:oligoendopeptidase F
MTLLKAAGVDLSEPSTIRAVVDQLDDLVGRLEKLL